VAQPHETLIDRYRLLSPVGAGAMSEVWAARDLRLGRMVAVKVLGGTARGDDDSRARFGAEARAAARLAHPNVVPVYDSGEHDGTPFLVMELLSGRTLADELGDGPLTEERAREIGAQVLAGLAASHRTGILHRDVKPANVLIAADGSARLADFGIAKTPDAADVTQAGIVVGTTAYLAPERLAGGPATARSDVYAVGVMLYEALAGHKPYEVDGAAALVAAIERGRYLPLGRVRPDLDPALATAVERAFAKDPADRFASADALRAALRPPDRSRGEAPCRARTTEADAVLASLDDQPATAILPAPAPGAVGHGPPRGDRVGRAQTRRNPLQRRADAAHDGIAGRVPGWRRMLIAAAVLVLGGTAVAIAARPGSPGPVGSADDPASAVGPGATTSIPASLHDAISRLDRAVRP
jgi:serine/threonine protein kinase